MFTLLPRILRRFAHRLQAPMVGLSLLCVLTGCNAPGVDAPIYLLETSPVESVAEATREPTQPSPPPEYPVAPFESDQLYDLLAAEVAVYRGELGHALESYMKVTRDSGDPGVASRAAMLARYLKRDDETIEAAGIWTAAEPDAVEGHRMMVELLMKRGQLKGAIAHLESVKRLGGLANFPLFAIQSENEDAETRDALLEAFDRMLVEYPDDPQLLFGRAVLMLREGRGEEALATAEHLLVSDLSVNTAILKVNALRLLGRTDDVLTFLDATVESFDDAAGAARLRTHYAQQLFEGKRFDEAKRQYQILLAGTPQDGNVLFALAHIAMEEKDDDGARDYLFDMVRWNKRAGEAHFYLGSIAERNNQPGVAIHEYMQAGSGYEFLPAQSRIASLMIDQGRLDEARGFLAQVRQTRNDLHDDLVLVEAQLLADRGFQNLVFDFMDASLAVDPDNTDFLYFRAMAGEKFGDLSILERDLRRVIELEPNNAAALNALGYTLTDQTNRHEEALVLINKALAIKPDEAAYIDSLGWVQFRLRNYEESLVHLRRALDLFPNDEVAAHLGEVLWVTGHEEEAHRIWAEALERKPESEILREVIQRLKAHGL